MVLIRAEARNGTYTFGLLGGILYSMLWKIWRMFRKHVQILGQKENNHLLNEGNARN